MTNDVSERLKELGLQMAKRRTSLGSYQSASDLNATNSLASASFGPITNKLGAGTVGVGPHSDFPDTQSF